MQALAAHAAAERSAGADAVRKCELKQLQMQLQESQTSLSDVSASLQRLDAKRTEERARLEQGLQRCAPCANSHLSLPAALFCTCLLRCWRIIIIAHCQ
jgi:chromosome segregation ATPase